MLLFLATESSFKLDQKALVSYYSIRSTPMPKNTTLSSQRTQGSSEVDNKVAVRATVKRLRLALGDTQQAFAHRLGLAISTVVRYELTRAPRGRALVELAELAMANGLEDCAKVFRNALLAGLGVPPTDGGTLAFPQVSGVVIAGPETTEQRNVLAAVLQLMREAEWPGPTGDQARREFKQLTRAIKRVQEEIIEAGSVDPSQGQNAAIIRLHRKGVQPAEIAARLHIEKDRVESLLSVFKEKR
jgi:transcriptional regulator with XRE-family HTH domain